MFYSRPCYVNLTNNVSTPLLRTTLNDWPEGTPDFVKHNVLKEYIQDTARKTGSEDNTIYGALVTQVSKIGDKWHVTYKTLQEDPQKDRLLEKEEVSV